MSLADDVSAMKWPLTQVSRFRGDAWSRARVVDKELYGQPGWDDREVRMRLPLGLSRCGFEVGAVYGLCFWKEYAVCYGEIKEFE